MEERNIKGKKKSFFCLFTVFFAVFTTHNLSGLLAGERSLAISCKEVGQQAPVDTSNSSKSIEKRIQKHIKQSIEDLGGGWQGERQFSAKYRSVHGLLELAHELSEITDSIALIYNAVSNPPFLRKNNLLLLDWKPFYGTRKELKKLRDGFFRKSHFGGRYFVQQYSLRVGEDGFIFYINKEEQLVIISYKNEEKRPLFPPENEEGFDIFVDRLFSGDRKKAAIAAAAVLNGELGIFRWRKLVEIILAGKENENSLADYPFEYLIGKITDTDTLEMFFFKKQHIHRLEHKVTSLLGVTLRAQVDPLNQVHRDQKQTETNEPIYVHFNLVMSDTEANNFMGTEAKNVIALRTRKSLTSEDVDQLLKELDHPNVIHVFLDEYGSSARFPISNNTKFIAGFVISEASEEARKKASKAGIYLIQIKGAGNYSVKATQLNSKPFKPKNFAVSLESLD